MSLSSISRAKSPSTFRVRFGLGERYSVLAADDSPLIRKTMKRAVDVFNQHSHDTQLDLTLAEDRLNAESILRERIQQEKPVDILITDNSMPQSDEGIRLSQFAQGLSKKPFIAMMSGDNIEDKARQAGIQAFFTKNNPISSVLQTVLELFQKGQQTFKPQANCAIEATATIDSGQHTKILMA